MTAFAVTRCIQRQLFTLMSDKPDTHDTYFLSLTESLIHYLFHKLISWLSHSDLYGGAALFCFLSACWDFFLPSLQINITQVRCCLCLRDVYAFPLLCTCSSIPVLVSVLVCVGACAREGNLTSVCSEWAQQCMVNPVTVCRFHLRQKEAANGMQEHADLVSKKGRKEDPLLFPPRYNGRQ